ncbi:MAG: dihydrolipoyllysine-residue acetyltransferase [Pseudomonadota bacterium]
MAQVKRLCVPDIGNFRQVEVIEVHVKVGDHLRMDAPIVTLETDKATLEVPATEEGVVEQVLVCVGDRVSQGDAVVEITLSALVRTATGEVPAETAASTTAGATPAVAAPVAAQTQELLVPDLGNIPVAEVIEIAVRVGDTIAVDAPLVVLESEKASLDVPATAAGVVEAVLVQIGDKVRSGTPLARIKTAGATAASAVPVTPMPTSAASATPSTNLTVAPQLAAYRDEPVAIDASKVYAGPATRRLARELSINLSEIKGTGPKGRIVPEDLHRYVRAKIASAGTGGGFAFPAMPDVDFSQWGAIRSEPLTRIQKKSGQNLHRNWVTIPHVTQFDEADISELEAFRLVNKTAVEAQGYRLTLLVLVLKALVSTLKAFPAFNASLSADGGTLIYKDYYHIGVAVDTPAGLVVPVLRHVDTKSILQLCKELSELSQAARLGQLSSDTMQGSTFTVSSLGGVGGTAFTPIINAPNVAILGLSRSKQCPVYQDGGFVPRLMLPLSLSYDHRVIDGAAAARFTTALAEALSNVQKIILS